MKTFRIIITAAMIFALLGSVLSAYGQDKITWERGRAICESQFQWDAEDGGSMEVEVEAMDVTVKGGSGGKLIMVERIVLAVDDEAEAREYYAKYKIESKKSGNDFTFRSPDTNRKYKGGTLNFQTPQTFNVEIATSGGDMDLENVNGTHDLTTSGGDIELGTITGDVEATTSGGDIDVDNMSGDLEASTSGGDISVTASGPNINVHTSGGDIDLTDVNGSVSGATSGGDIELEDLDGGAELATSGGDIVISSVTGSESVEAATSGGSIEAENIQANLELATSSGDIVLSNVRGTVEVATSNGDIQGEDIEGASIEAATSHGDIVLEDVAGELDVATSSGDIHAKIKKTSEFYAIELETSAGDIQCSLPKNYKGSVEAKIHHWSKHSSQEIESDFPLSVRTEDSDTRVATGDINGGGPEINLETSRGDIEIDKY